LSGAVADTNIVSSAAFRFEADAANTGTTTVGFVTSAGQTFNVPIDNTTVLDDVNNDANLRAAGIFAVNISDGGAGTEVAFVSLKDFSINIQNTNVFAQTTTGTESADDPAANGVAGGAGGARAALEAIKEAVASLGLVQGTVGSAQNNLAQAIDLATAQVTSFQASESTIRDADIASEASNLARLTTLQQAGVAALAQANQSSQALLSLLR
jgi:flagellin